MKPDLRPVADDQDARKALTDALRAAGLPSDDVDGGARFFALMAGDEVLGHGGLEGEGPDQLLRSLVTPPRFRNQGHGAGLVAGLMAQARADGAERLWLLTLSAQDFFARLGWREVDRATAPPAIAAVRQFTGLCPSSAVLMCLKLR